MWKAMLKMRYPSLRVLLTCMMVLFTGHVGFIPVMSGYHGASSCLHSEAPPSFRCHATKMKRKGWKRYTYLQQRIRQERLNHSRKWKGDHDHNMTVKMVEEDENSALLELENSQSGLQISVKGTSVLDDSSQLDVLHNDLSSVVDSDGCCLAKDSAPQILHDSAERNKVGLNKIISEDLSSSVTSNSSSLYKDYDFESEGEDNDCSLNPVTAIDVPDEDSSCEVSKFILQSKRHSDKDLDNPKPSKFRKPVEDFSDLSCKYSIQSHCSVDDHIPDGFYDAGRHQPFRSLQDFEQNLCLDSREVILLDRRKDEELEAIIFSAQLLMSSFKRSSSNGREENLVDNFLRASVLALFVSDCFGGSERSASVMKMRRSILGLHKQQPFVCTCPARDIFEKSNAFKRMHDNVANANFTLHCENSLRLIKETQKSNVVPIGTLRFGICRHRAVLMKYLCDRVDPPIPCELVRGYLDFMPHAWNVVHVRRGNSLMRMVVDACYPTDIREETDIEYFCRYIPLSRLCGPIGTQNSPIPACSSPFPSLDHGINSRTSSSLLRCKFGTGDAAVKVRYLEADQTSDEDIRNFEYRLLGEVRILNALRNHSCIVEIYGHQLSRKWLPATDGKKEYRLLRSMIIMEYVNGGSLKNYLVQLTKEGQKHVPADIALCIARDVAYALVEVHSKQIIHRDIKRTPRWMAPEVVEAMHKKNPYGLEVDIWSYGCLLLELLTLQAPYQGRSESELYDLLQMQQRPRLTPELEALASSPEEKKAISQAKIFSDAEAEILKLLVDLFYQCTRGNPADRPSAKHIYDSLSVVSSRVEAAHVTGHND
ncbi:STYKc [Musa troglodytarum]|uniref:STYKc n=1 Tax=Musa troglodytarum TaxID=320322 RepID=A0A9E7JBA2_9LILI|nr:STYKc [Musa troglodytarum]